MVKKLSVFAITLLLLFPLSLSLLGWLGYFGERSFEHIGKLPDTTDVINYSKQLIGTPYDPFMGKYGNVGAKLGFVVCTDVPNIAYGLSGFSLKKMLADNFKNNPAAYNTANSNNPSNPYFHRRARNLFSYFSSTGRLKPADSMPAVGDLVFYRSSPKGWINHVALVSSVSSSGYTIVESAPRTIVVQEVDAQSPIDRGWILSGFGRLYD